jgi:hypothetical protein
VVRDDPGADLPVVGVGVEQDHPVGGGDLAADQGVHLG